MKKSPLHIPEKNIHWIALCALGAGLLIFILTPHSTDAPPVPAPVEPVVSVETIRNGTAPIPSAPTEREKAILANSDGFQYLISFTGDHFEPSTTTIKKGETVRFSNNSPMPLWLTADARQGVSYPSAGGCGVSALDSCGAIQPQEFWEFTFTESGTWGLINTFESDTTGTVVVQVADE
ncbi:MAG: hypothetical protein KBE09_02825 [Candidatus Pacebacteria bacterium]|nr:hypothetical protein [Candidatus Paceibacterota bacterium]